jgi:phosphoglycerate kinase
MVQPAVCCSDRYAGCGPPAAAAPEGGSRPAVADASEPLSGVISELLGPSFDLAAPSLQLAGKRVLLRADLNVPVDSGDHVSDANRIDAVLPTIRLLQSRGARVVVASHFGRPSPSKQTWEQMLQTSSLAPVAAYLRQQLGDSFQGLAPDCVGPQVEAAVTALQHGQVLLLENTRFHAEETSNDAAFAAALARLADVFVNDAFGVCHRDQASVAAVAQHVACSLPGPLVRHELRYLGRWARQRWARRRRARRHAVCHAEPGRPTARQRGAATDPPAPTSTRPPAGSAMDAPKRPLCVVMGGAKVADKIGVLWSMLDKADVVAVSRRWQRPGCQLAGRQRAAGRACRARRRSA